MRPLLRSHLQFSTQKSKSCDPILHDLEREGHTNCSSVRDSKVLGQGSYFTGTKGQSYKQSTFHVCTFSTSDIKTIDIGIHSGSSFGHTYPMESSVKTHVGTSHAPVFSTANEDEFLIPRRLSKDELTQCILKQLPVKVSYCSICYRKASML